ncbi:hypothetical protein TWF694_001985 [Orbilia ellipsospora]|uniref:Uncharacterized protein n=1 Tax=Orbilia ellipsospora TaxID=2528407 RepID=A0AAV9X493_9PEZI
MAPRIKARDLTAQAINIKYNHASDISDLFPSAPPETEDYASQINDIMQNTAQNLFQLPEDEPFRKLLEQCLHNISKRPHTMFSSTTQDANASNLASASSQGSQGTNIKEPKRGDDLPRAEWQILPDFFSEVSRCLNRIDKRIGYRVHRTHRKGFRVPIGKACFQRNDCGQYIEVVKGGSLKPYTRWPLKAVFYTTHLGPSSAEDLIAGEILSLVTQVAFNFENDPQTVQGDQECFCITLHGQYVHFSTTTIPDKYIRYHNSGRSLKELEEVTVTFSPEYNLAKAEDRFHVIWGFVGLYLHLNPIRRKQGKAKEIVSSVVPVEDIKAALTKSIHSLGLSE